MEYVPPLGAADPDESYVDGNPAAGIEGSPVPAAAIEGMLREIIQVIVQSGLEPTGADLTQLADAIELLIADALDLGGYLARDEADVLTAGYFTAPVAAAIAAGHVALDPAAGNVFTVAVTAPFTLDFPAGLAGKAGMILVIATQDGAGGHALTTAAGYHAAAGSWSTEANAVNLIWITSDGGGAALDVVIAQRGA
jgi:hypothetical protein